MKVTKEERKEMRKQKREKKRSLSQHYEDPLVVF